MAVAVLLSIYCGVFTFVLGCVRRILQYSRTPMHLRWELYPVPHETGERAAYGGSYFEETEWWTKKRSRSLFGELRFMLPEMLLLRGLWQFNRRLWFRSFTFHAGLYLIIGSAILSFGNTFAEHWVLIPGMARAVSLSAWTGLLLLLMGGTALFHMRLRDPKFRTCTTIGDLFNVGAFAAAAALLMLGGVAGTMPSVAVLTRAVLSCDASLHIPVVGGCGLLLAAFMAGYVPFTHMGHFVAKYFTYHAVRWDDEPSMAGGRLAKQMARQLTYRPTWSAPHLGADGKRTWADVATSNPAKADEVRK